MRLNDSDLRLVTFTIVHNIMSIQLTSVNIVLKFMHLLHMALLDLKDKCLGTPDTFLQWKI